MTFGDIVAFCLIVALIITWVPMVILVWRSYRLDREIEQRLADLRKAREAEEAQWRRANLLHIDARSR